MSLVSCPRNKHMFRCDQNGPPARREEGASSTIFTPAGRDLNSRSVKMVLDVTDEQRSRRPVFIAPSGPRPVGCFCVRRPPDSLLTYRSRHDRRSRLEKQPTDPAMPDEAYVYFGDRTLARACCEIGCYFSALVGMRRSLFKAESSRKRSWS